MLGLYYRIWVDAIVRARSIPANKNNWASTTMIFMSLAMMLNLILGMTMLQKYILGYYFYYIELVFLPRYLANVVSGIILFIIPCVLINYFLIFHKERYHKLIKKYPYSDGKFFLTYFFISMLLPLILLFGGILLGKIKLGY